jgi:N utilization substance protein B
MPARSKARKRALDILFEAEIRGEPVLALLDERAEQASPPVAAYAADLVRGIQLHRDSIDKLLGEYAEGWTLERMPAVDRNILRIGAYELLWNSGVPDGVAISEAVLLARQLSTDSSPGFVNGLLARLLELKPTLGPEQLAAPPAAPPELLAAPPEQLAAGRPTAADSEAEPGEMPGPGGGTETGGGIGTGGGTGTGG